MAPGFTKLKSRQATASIVRSTIPILVSGFLQDLEPSISGASTVHAGKDLDIPI